MAFMRLRFSCWRYRSYAHAQPACDRSLQDLAMMRQSHMNLDWAHMLQLHLAIKDMGKNNLSGIAHKMHGLQAKKCAETRSTWSLEKGSRSKAWLPTPAPIHRPKDGRQNTLAWPNVDSVSNFMRIELNHGACSIAVKRVCRTIAVAAKSNAPASISAIDSAQSAQFGNLSGSLASRRLHVEESMTKVFGSSTKLLPQRDCEACLQEMPSHDSV